MYTAQETSAIRQQFWTRFGQYMRPLPGAEGEPVSWLNYKTGNRFIAFRMDADAKTATIGIELKHKDSLFRQQQYQQLEQLKKMLETTLGENWDWQPERQDANGASLSWVGTTLTGINVLKESDWPAIISFLKPRIMALDEFWSMVKDAFTY